MQTIEPHDDHAAAAHAFGALATRLNESLGQASNTLTQHTAVLPDGVLAELEALRAEFERRRVRIAVYGEVKAGKSTLVNALAGAVLSPAGFEPITSVPVRVTYGSETRWRIGNRTLQSVAELESVMRNGLADPGMGNGAGEVVVETPLDMLQLGGQVDVVDTPGVGSSAQFDAVSAAALRSLDAAVLVVRYPALFTQFTRRLMDGLQVDIGKLFVVWNLDADCAELAPEERRRHAETLRANVAGAHELFLVDARAGLRAMQAEDAGGSVTSGLTALIAALTRFVSSGGREVTALREAAKRAHERLVEAHRCLTERQAVLERALGEARARLRAAQTAADAQAAAARGRFAECEAALTRARQQAAATAAKIASELRRELRAARRRWARSGHSGAIEAALATPNPRDADSTEAANRATADSARAAAAQFGTSVPLDPRPRTEPPCAEVTPEERARRATRGRWQWLRRTLWHRWYLPGLAALEHSGLTADLAAQAAWVAQSSQAAHDAASAVLASRLDDITRRAAAETERIKVETNFNACTAESERLSQDVPVVAAQHGSVAQIATEARGLL
jgi:hypothetical protein